MIASANSELFQRRAKEDGIELDINGPEHLARFMKVEEDRWRVVVRDAGIKPD